MLGLNEVYKEIKDKRAERKEVKKFDDFIDSLRGAHHFIEMVTDLNPDFYNNPEVKLGLNRALDKGVKVRIIYSPEANLDGSPHISRLLEEEHILSVMSDKELNSHYTVFDGRHIMLKNPETEKSVFIRNSIRLALKYHKVFSNEFYRLTS